VPYSLSPPYLWLPDLCAAGTSRAQSSCQALHVPICKFVLTLKHMHCCLLLQNKLPLACQPVSNPFTGISYFSREVMVAIPRSRSLLSS
jgi:hypothetical protein